MIESVVTFKWHPKPGYRSMFTSEHVNALHRSFFEHYPVHHRFICITDDPRGLDSDIEAVPLWDTFSNLRNPTWPQGPSCYRRLLTFGRDFAKIAGERFLCTDIDVVLTGDMTPIIDRSEPFVIWGTGNRRIPYCASMYLMTAGCHQEILDQFNPRESPSVTNLAGFKGSDQAWINYCLGADIPTWHCGHGMYSYRDHVVKTYGGKLPANARAIIFHGKPDPWDAVVRARSPWITRHYHSWLSTTLYQSN